jgi:hypothetical protein
VLSGHFLRAQPSYRRCRLRGRQSEVISGHVSRVSRSPPGRRQNEGAITTINRPDIPLKARPLGSPFRGPSATRRPHGRGGEPWTLQRLHGQRRGHSRLAISQGAGDSMERWRGQGHPPVPVIAVGWGLRERGADLSGRLNLPDIGFRRCPGLLGGAGWAPFRVLWGGHCGIFMGAIGAVMADGIRASRARPRRLFANHGFHVFALRQRAPAGDRDFLVSALRASHRTDVAGDLATQSNLRPVSVPPGAAGRLEPLDRTAFGAGGRGTTAIPAHVRRYHRPEGRPRDAACVPCLAWDRPSTGAPGAAWEICRAGEGWVESDGRWIAPREELNDRLVNGCAAWAGYVYRDQGSLRLRLRRGPGWCSDIGSRAIYSSTFSRLTNL